MTRNTFGEVRPNHHYDLCDCGHWKKRTSRVCQGCRGPRSLYPLCRRKLHPLSPEARAVNGGCEKCRRMVERGELSTIRAVRARAPDIAPVRAWPVEEVPERMMVWRYYFG